MTSFTTDPQAAKTAEYREEERAHYQDAELIARVGHAAIQALEEFDVGQSALPRWDQLPPETRQELVAGVQYIFDHPNAPVSAQHDAWLARNAHRLAPDDPRRKAYADLTYGQQLKAALWRHICHAFAG